MQKKSKKGIPHPKHSYKIELWLAHYLNDEDPKTFLNATRSAMAAKYDCKTYKSFAYRGTVNLEICRPKIDAWFDEIGMSEHHIKARLVKLMNATKVDVRTYPSNHIVEREEIPDTQAQLQALRLASKIKGLDAPQKHEHSGPDGAPIECRITPDMSDKEAADVYAQLLKEMRHE